MRDGLTVFGLAVALALPGVRAASAHEEHDEAREGVAISGFERRFALPAPGSYELPPIGHVAEHALLDPEGNREPLLGLDPGQLALVAFIYASCPEGWGCPFALAVLQRVDRFLAEHPELSARVRLVTVSFDPARDTPPRMAQLREQLRPASDWRFLTAGSEAEIRPVLEDYGQDVLPLVDPGGAATGLLRHVLKMFLVDSERAIRNIYSVGFLAPEILLVDLQTLLRAQAPTLSPERRFD